MVDGFQQARLGRIGLAGRGAGFLDDLVIEGVQINRVDLGIGVPGGIIKVFVRETVRRFIAALVDRLTMGHISKCEQLDSFSLNTLQGGRMSQMTKLDFAAIQLTAVGDRLIHVTGVSQQFGDAVVRQVGQQHEQIA